jgi:hypothetical protein
VSQRESIGVSKLAFYAEDPVRYAKSNGQPYNAKAARVGEKNHNAIGKLPSKAVYAVIVIAVIAAYLYLKA